MASPAAVLSILVTANTAQATAALSKTQAQLGSTAAASGAMSKAVAVAGKAAALATVGIGVASVKLATDFEKSMRNVNSIAQLPEGALSRLQDRVLDLAGKTAQAPKTLAEGLYDLVSSGFDADESMKILASSAKAATAGLTTTEVSTKAVAAVLNAYRMPAEKASHVSDVLFRTVDRGVVSFEELSSTIGDVLPFAASLGVRLEEVGAATATMTKAGISPAETMTRLKAVMSALIKPSVALEKTLRQQGFESGEALIKAKGLQGALDLLAKSTGGSKAEMAKLFPNIRALGGALALTGKNSKSAAEDLKGMGEASGATSRALSQQSKSLSHAWQELSARVQALLIKIGQQLIPVLAKVTKFFSENETALVVLGTVIAAAGAAWVAYKVHAMAAAVATTVATGGLNLIIPALAALAVGLVVAFKKSETFREIVTAAFEAVKSVAKDVFGWLKNAVRDVVQFIAARWENLKTIIRAYWDGYRTLIINPMRAAFNWLRQAVDSIAGFLGDRWQNIKDVVSAAWDAVRRFIVNPVRDAAQAVRSALGGEGLLGWLRERVSDFVNVAERIGAPFVKVFNGVVDVLKRVIGFLKDVVQVAKDAASFIGKIKLPDIDIPTIPNPFRGGAGNGTTVGPVFGVDSFTPLAASFGNMVTSGYRPGDPGWHGQNRARDYAGGNMMGFARAMLKFAPKLLELIFTPLGVGVKNGSVVPISFFGRDVMADHYDHVHVAMARGGKVLRGGWAMVGEQGPELAQLPSGARVYSNSQSMQMIGGGDPIQIQVLVKDGAVDPRKIEVIADRRIEVVTRRAGRHGSRGLPGRGGGLNG